MREIVLDTETTGLDPADGHRVVEIACIELHNHLPTGKFFHRYVNPERAMTAEAEAVHGLGDDFLRRHQPFAAIAAEFVAFIGDAQLVAHNAGFDLAFVNAELKRLDLPPFSGAVVDTLEIARKRFPGASASLDALCRRFAIDLSAREKHGAKLDCELLAKVYLELVGGRQSALDLGATATKAATRAASERPARAPRHYEASADELARHAALVAKLKAPIWQN
ncbi:MAG: DNA polymerase III subunit epsilon [Alphaproteobacteria bacterium]|nr:DNA polymerase III subunit epsilon [Alphaproteobacteria bacterium]MDE2513007.1 DNA polymerase III subunit epsilon [Alphaproteobacteria bacterium]